MYGRRTSSHLILSISDIKVPSNANMSDAEVPLPANDKMNSINTKRSCILGRCSYTYHNFCNSSILPYTSLLHTL